MSQFLPEQPSAAPTSTPDLSSLAEATQGDIDLMTRVLNAAGSRPDLIPAQFMAYVLDYIQTSNLLIPIGQIFGFSQFVASVASTIDAPESTTSMTYADLTTVGPSLTGLPNGQYLVLFGCTQSSTGGVGGYMSVETTGTGASDNYSTQGNSSAFVSAEGFTVLRLASGNNTVTAKYRVDGAGTGTFQHRRLAVFKFANL